MITKRITKQGIPDLELWIRIGIRACIIHLHQGSPTLDIFTLKEIQVHWHYYIQSFLGIYKAMRKKAYLLKESCKMMKQMSENEF